MKAPAITVLMPVYNAEKYLREAIESVLNQTFTDFELLIINDGSTDRSEEIILSYNDPRIQYEKNEVNLKLIATLNKGFGLAKGKYVVRTDADDINHLDRLKLQYAFMEAHPEIGLSGTGFEIFGENIPTKIVQYAPDHNTICLKHLYQIHLSHGTSIFRMSVIREHNLFFDPSYSHAEDYELWTRVSRVTRLANIPQVLYRVRHHEHEVSKLFSGTQQQNSFKIKHGQFLQMGLELSAAEIDLFTALAQYEYRKENSFVQAAKELLEKLVKANDRSKFLEVSFFRKSMAQFWLNTTYNCSSLGMFSFKQYLSSPLNNYRPLSNIEWLKFFIKAFLRK